MPGVLDAKHSSRPFGELLKKHRLASGLSQEELADAAHISVETISALERGARRRPYRDTIGHLADALHLSRDARSELESAAGRHAAEAGELVPHNLPQALSTFIGREEETAYVAALVSDHRLVTLVGSGGVGKTRLALMAAAFARSRFADGVWFVDLAAISDGALLPSAIATVLRVDESSGVAVADGLTAFLKDRRLLLVLDNCEHVVAEVAPIVGQILERSAHVVILATSREPLKIANECAHRVPSMTFPSPELVPILSVEDALGFSSVALFAERARAADTRFALNERTLPAVAEICRRLDGVPLAIELAAARIGVLGAAALVERLKERFQILTAGCDIALPRHKTMRALMDWSYELLDDDEQWLFRRLSIFAGGFSLELATSVCLARTALSEYDVLNLLASLVDKSLVQSDISGEVTRYRLLETTRTYAREKLLEHGERIEASQAHARSLFALANRFDEDPNLTPDRAWIELAKPERENWDSALEWTLGSRGEVALGQRMACAPSGTWFGAISARGEHWVRVALSLCDDSTPTELSARLKVACARIAGGIGQMQKPETLMAAEEALALYRQAHIPLGIIEAEYYVGISRLFGNRPGGEAAMESALASARALRANKVIPRLLHGLALACYFKSDLTTARAHFREAMTLYKDAGCFRDSAEAASNLAELEFQLGDAETALDLAEQALDTLQRDAGFGSQANAMCNCAAYLVALNRFNDAREVAREAAVTAQRRGSSLHVMLALQHLGAIATLRRTRGPDALSDIRRGARLLGFVDARCRALAYQRQYTDQHEYDRVAAMLDKRLGSDVEKFRSVGRLWPEDEALAKALEI